MKKLLTFMMLLCTAALASNEPLVLNISGQSYVAKYSYGVKYHMGVGGHLNGDPRGRYWWVVDSNGVTQNDWIISGRYNQDVKINILGDCTIYAQFHYEEWGSGLDKYIYDEYEVRTGTPTFTVDYAGSIHNGQFDTTVTGVTTRVIHFNIDSDYYRAGVTTVPVNQGIVTPDFLIQHKTAEEDDDILPFYIKHFPAQMYVKCLRIGLEIPNHLALYRKGSALEDYFMPLGATGTSSVVNCGDNETMGRIFDGYLYLEGTALGVGHLKIDYLNLNGGVVSQIADLKYKTCADVSGRQPLSNGTTLESMEFDDQLDGCEWSLFDESNSSFSSSYDYNAPAFAVDHNWNVVNNPFKVWWEDVGTSDDPIIVDPASGKYVTSYEAFGGVREFFESTLWTPQLSLGGSLHDSVVLYYFTQITEYYSWAALRSWSTTGTLPAWNMFYMKLDSGPILNHRGEVLFDYSSGLNYSPGPMKFMLNSND
ncbi:hypothetical protein J6U78_00080 [bacterium]|nr:hypothetical protein [bacterium]